LIGRAENKERALARIEAIKGGEEAQAA